MRTFIIGNGFDLAHNMPTKYSDFKKYLIERFPNSKNGQMYVPGQMITPDGGVIVDETEAASLLVYLINNACGGSWSDFETALGKINLFECFEDLCEVYDRDGDRNLFHEAYNNEDRAADLYHVIPLIKVFFSDWVDTIELPQNSLTDFSNIIDPEEDLFISFNYTQTLEKLYGCKNVIHLHGEKGGDIIIGHNGNIDYSEDNSSVPIGCFSTLQDIYEILRKDTESVIHTYYNYLKRVSCCHQVYSYGFSYSSVDLPYIKTICQMLKGENSVWLFNSYDADDFDKISRYKEIIRNSGFNGSFSVY
ncbi:MAG: bacteriophage abortive infection AbiH family protein [Clostridia bacterium]|nr:bacteriophage abortive infection AbiH family protein [Clostridia bacterium]